MPYVSCPSWSCGAGEQLHVLSGLSVLRDLNMKGCYRVADQGLSGVGSLTHLQRLNLQGCWQITASGLATLSGSLPIDLALNLFWDISLDIASLYQLECPCSIM